MISVVTTSYNEGSEIFETILSIRRTSPPTLEIVVVDDCSSRPIVLTPDCGQCKLIRTRRRIGVGPSRYLGTIHATGEQVLYVDAHSRFVPGWHAATIEALEYTEQQCRPTTVHCGSCLGLGFNGTKEMNMDVNRPNAEYHGATWNFYGPDRKSYRDRCLQGMGHLPNMQVFETVWADKREDDGYELSGIMGACYIAPREWYLRLNCGRNLVSYGCDEQELALKTWLAGGEVRMLKGLRIGHKFKEAKRGAGLGVAPYNSTHYVVMNKIFLILTLLPRTSADVLISKLRHEREFGRAMKLVESNWAAVECERALNQRLFTRDFHWFISHFGLSFPG